ncbi:MAG: 2,3-bisphosphoglycerate-dependent phosphoglycerate mutase [Patescibacteria group bacterium]
MAKLVLVRHGKSEWNALGKWTGKTDVDLALEGIEEAQKAGIAIQDIEIHSAYTSSLKRAKDTLKHLKSTLEKNDFNDTHHEALDERDYGVYTGKNKWQVKEEVGEEEFQKIRRGWDTHIPEGETLKDVYERVMPYFKETILQELINGKNVLVVSHGNTLRAIIKDIEGLDENQICEMEVGTGEVHCYDIDDRGSFLGKEIRVGEGDPPRP